MIRPGQTIGRYHVDEIVGQGGMGTVFRATTTDDGSVVALKVMADGDDRRRQSFAREAAALASLDHAALPRIIDLVELDELQCLVMSYVDGEDLASMLSRRTAPLPIDDVLDWSEQALDALVYLHSRTPPVIHRDIKPANMKIHEGRVTLVDFGLAKGGEGDARSLPGFTLTYAPPEQIRGEGTGARSDLYSLAATMYEMLTMRPPAGAMQRLSERGAGRADPLRPVHVRNPQAQPALSRLILQALSLDIHERPDSSATMREILHSIRTGNDATVWADEPSVMQSPGNLPVASSPLIGRDQVLSDLLRLVGDGRYRLVTLTGPGGVGKTRLALDVATAVASNYSAGAWWIDLARVKEERLVPDELRTTLGIAGAHAESAKEHVISFLKSRQQLLVLDNVEHLPGAGAFVAELLAKCPHLQFVATGRAPLRIGYEHEFPVDPLDLPVRTPDSNADAVSANPAVQLFTLRAQSIDPGFQLNDENAGPIAEICRRLDGLPLAIELAAARTRILDPEALLQRLDRRLNLLTGGNSDLPGRQRTLRSAISWSVDLLSPDERRLFMRLSVFVGGWDAETVETLVAKTNALDLLGALVDQSLVRRHQSGGVRFTFLQTIREYALEQLVAGGLENDAYGDLVNWSLSLAEQARTMSGASIDARWNDRLSAELPNFRASLNWLLRDADRRLDGVRLLVLLWRFWERRGLFHEAAEWFELGLSERGLPSTLRAEASIGAGVMARHLGQYEVAVGRFESALELIDGTKNPDLQAIALGNRGHVRRLLGDYSGALADLEATLQLATKAGDDERISSILNHLGVLKQDLGEIPAALDFYRQSLAMKRQLGDERGVAFTLNNLGLVAYEAGQPEQAMAYYEESLAIKVKLGDALSTASTIGNMAMVARHLGDIPRAIALHNEEMAIKREKGGEAHLGSSELNLALAYIEDGDLGQAEALILSSLERLTAIGEKRTIARAQAALADIRQLQGDSAGAIRMAETALESHREVGDTTGIVFALIALAEEAIAAGDPPVALSRAREALSVAIGSERAGLIGEAIALAVKLFRATGQSELAAKILAFRRSYISRSKMRPSAADARFTHEQEEALSGALGSDTFARISDLGSQMVIDDLVSLLDSCTVSEVVRLDRGEGSQPVVAS